MVVDYDPAMDGDVVQDDKDCWEGGFWDVPVPRPITASFHLRYRDGNGALSERDVDIWQYGILGDAGLLIGRCHLRQATRTFRTDRILSCVDIVTGEVVKDVLAWLNDRWERSPEKALTEISDSHWNALRIMYYISKADGMVNKKERVILRQAAREILQRTDLTDARVDTFFKSLELPSIPVYRKTCSVLSAQDALLARRVLEWGEAIVATQAKVSAEEQGALEYLRLSLQPH